MAESMLAKVKRLEALRALRAQLKVDAAYAWAAYYKACDRAEAGRPDPETGGIPAATLANIERLGDWAEAVEDAYHRAYRAEQVLAGEILGMRNEELGIADEGNEELRNGELGIAVVVPMVAQVEAVG